MRKKMKSFVRTLSLLLAWLALVPLFAQQPEPLPIDPKLRYGKLSNGLTYYIRHNTLPKERADFYIAQNVGSILEEENQRGLAHFLEHMAFDGTANFPNNGMDKYIERVGMRNGENFNAYTSFDETVYMVTNAPVKTAGVVDSCLLILHDWSGFIALTDSAIKKERGVIREEWRTRQDAQMRLFEQQLPAMFPGSRYANRMPIGTIEVIEGFKPDELRAYYKKWYRPDQQAIIVVGDIDVDQVEASLQRIFADIPAPVNPAVRKPELVPDNIEPLVSIATDKEANNFTLSLYYKHDNLPKERRATIEGVVVIYCQQIASLIMAERFDELLQQANPPFIYAEAYDSDHFLIAKTKGAWTTAALAREGEVDSTLVALVKETRRVKQYGFTASEYERAKINLLKSYESAFNERENQKNSTYVKEYVNHFTDGGYIPGIEVEYALANQLAAQLTVADVNQYVGQVIGDDNIVISLTGPEKEGLTYPSEAELLRTFNAAQQIPVGPYEETVSTEPLIPQLPAPGKIVESRQEERFGETVLTLSNGVKVVLKPTSFKKDQILMTATSPGGSTCYGEEESRNLKLFNDVVELGGLGNFSATDLSKRLAGKKVSCAISLGWDSELVNGMAAPADLKTLFELIYLAFTSPRMDEAAYASFESRMRAQLRNSELNPMVAFNDSITSVVYANHPSALRLKAADFDQVSYQRIMAIRDERFGDASDFVFSFVGNIPMDSIRPLVEQYLATLPSTKRVEQADPARVPQLRQGAHSCVFSQALEIPKVSVFHLYSGQMPYDLEHKVMAVMTKQILDLAYYEQVREAEGGTYGVGVSTAISSFPKGRTTLQIYFDTDPEKWERMGQIIQEVLRRFATEGPKAEDFKKTQDNLLKRFAEVTQENSYWLNVLATYYEQGLDLSSDYEAVVRGMTPAKIQSFVKRFLDQGNHVEVVMKP